MQDNDAELAAIPTGAAIGAYLAAAIGAFSVGLIALLDAAGALSIPELYAPAGGVTGRTALGVVVWLVVWLVLHQRWKERDVNAGRVHVVSVVLILVGIVCAFPPVWGLFE